MISYAPEIQPTDLHSFLKYCEIFEKLLNHHHHNEEEAYFVLLEEKLGAGSMKDNVEGHKGFHEPYAAWSRLCDGFRMDTIPWDPIQFIMHVRAFALPLIEHLGEEIQTLNAEVIRQKFTQLELTHIEKAMEEELKKTPLSEALVWQLPFILVNGDGVKAKWFPAGPAPLIFVSRHILYHLHSDIWRFGCTDKYMKVKQRFAAYERS
ncbi:hypothetical protein FRC03_000125 [Tulasnella sp. 419]|nr:hypothetical protein FRC03_000125 [Tulasnella sp. 419]